MLSDIDFGIGNIIYNEFHIEFDKQLKSISCKHHSRLMYLPLQYFLEVHAQKVILRPEVENPPCPSRTDLIYLEAAGFYKTMIIFQ